jgi:transcriptional regulator with XRE-family HTH domain
VRKLAERVGRRVAEERRAAKLTQARLAELCGLQLRSFQDLEAGLLNTTLATIESVAAALNIDPVKLFEPPREPNRPRRRGRPRKGK